MKPGVIASFFRRTNGWHIALSLFLVCLTVFLSVRASDPYRWSDWGFGDAQSMLSLRQWEEGGWIANYFLFIPQGYAKAVQLLDDPQLRHHAHGTCPGSSPVGPRLWYTHYPAGYLVPYALLFRIGLDSLFSARMLSIAMSVAALLLMYSIFARMTSRSVAFFGVFFYALAPTFFGYSDTIANQPLDDLLRFAFMYAVILSTRAETQLLRSRWAMAAWGFEFFLSLSSFDSVFFLFAWVIGWDILDRQGFRWKRYFVYGMAAVSSHSLQFLQNVWYLGFDDALTDIVGTFLRKNAADTGYNIDSYAGSDRVSVTVNAFVTLFENLYSPAIFVAVMASFYLAYAMIFRDEGDRGLPSISILLVLFFCGLAFILVLPHAARMPYESRQMIPFVSMLVGGVMSSFLFEFRNGLFGKAGRSDQESRFRMFARPVYLFVCLLALLVFWYRFALNDRAPTYYIPDQETDARYAQLIETTRRFDLARYRALRSEALLAEELAKIRTAYEPVYFSARGFQLFWDPKYVPGYPQIMPLIEYYAGSRPILCFDMPESIGYDLAYMIDRSPARFSPVLIMDGQGQLDTTISQLFGQGILSGGPVPTFEVMGRYVADLTGYIRWPGR